MSMTEGVKAMLARAISDARHADQKGDVRFIPVGIIRGQETGKTAILYRLSR